MAAGEIRVGNSILPNLTIAAASTLDDETPQDDDVLIFQDNEMDKMDPSLSLGFDQRVIRPNVSTNHRENDGNVRGIRAIVGGRDGERDVQVATHDRDCPLQAEGNPVCLEETRATGA